MSDDLIDLPVDPVLGDLRAALAPARVLAECREQLRRNDAASRSGWRHCRMVEALIDPGRYIRVAYVLLEDGGVPESRQWPEGQIVYLHAPTRRPVSRRGEEIEIDGLRLEAYAFPNDRRLRGLRRFVGRDDALHTWRSWLGERGVSFDANPDTLQRLLLRYVPEQKWIVRLRVEGQLADGTVKTRRIAVRSAAPAACRTLHDRHQRLARAASEGAFALPAVVGFDAEDGLLAVEWDRGLSLVETLRTMPAAGVFARVSRGLSALHACSPLASPVLTAEDLWERVHRAVADLAAVLPNLGSRMFAVEREFAARLRELADAEPVLLHNDFHWNQVRIKGERLTILDLERLARGDAALDVANFATQLRMLGCRPEIGVGAAEAATWADEFLETWAERTGQAPEGERLQVYSALSALELARGMMRHVRAGWAALASASLAHAERELSGAAFGANVT